MRPSPDANPDAVIENIHALLNEFATRFGRDLNPRGDEYPCGGHIHVGILVRGGFPYGYSPRKTVSVLDAFIGIPTRSLNGCARGDYAYLGSYENKEYGFEYRTPPAAIFADKVVLRQVLDIVQRVAFAVLTNGLTYHTDPVSRAATRESYEELLGYMPEAFLAVCDAGVSVVPETMMAAWMVTIPDVAAATTEDAGYQLLDGRIRFASGTNVYVNDTWDSRATVIFSRAIAAEIGEVENIDPNIYYSLFGIREDHGCVVSGMGYALPYGFYASAHHSHMDHHTMGIPACCRWGDNFDADLAERLSVSVARAIAYDLSAHHRINY